jgi:hypothetical protein
MCVHIFLFHTTLPRMLTRGGMNDTQLSMIVENCVHSTSTDFYKKKKIMNDSKH